jgi:hypothetical protein
MTRIGQPKWPNRKPPVFVRCGTEFRNFSGQRWCSIDCARAAKRGVRRASPKSPIAEKAGRDVRADAGRTVPERDQCGTSSQRTMTNRKRSRIARRERWW